MNILGLAGPRQVGKSSAVKIIKKLLPNFNIIKMSFADSLKSFCNQYLGVPEQNMYGTNEEKEKVIGKLSDYIKYIPEGNYLIPVEHSTMGNIDVGARQVLQIIGTNIIRNIFNNDFWVDIIIRNIKNLNHKLDESEINKTIVVIDDFRFINEINKLKKMGTKVIKMYRDTGLNLMEHSSEKEIAEASDTLFDYIITKEQNVNLDTLESALKEILFKEGLKVKD